MASHGPLADTSSAIFRNNFIIVCPQLPYPGGDVWKKHPGTIQKIMKAVCGEELGDPDRLFLTGFSYGGHGVFDLARISGVHWKGLWAVDPPEIPHDLPGYPTCLSVGSLAKQDRSRILKLGFVSQLDVPESPYIYRDYGKGHVETSWEAYADDNVGHWLIRRAVR